MIMSVPDADHIKDKDLLLVTVMQEANADQGDAGWWKNLMLAMVMQGPGAGHSDAMNLC